MDQRERREALTSLIKLFTRKATVDELCAFLATMPRHERVDLLVTAGQSVGTGMVVLESQEAANELIEKIKEALDRVDRLDH